MNARDLKKERCKSAELTGTTLVVTERNWNKTRGVPMASDDESVLMLLADGHDVLLYFKDIVMIKNA